jgi:hypothetical protein
MNPDLAIWFRWWMLLSWSSYDAGINTFDTANASLTFSFLFSGLHLGATPRFILMDSLKLFSGKLLNSLAFHAMRSWWWPRYVGQLFNHSTYIWRLDWYRFMVRYYDKDTELRGCIPMLLTRKAMSISMDWVERFQNPAQMFYIFWSLSSTAYIRIR